MSNTSLLGSFGGQDNSALMFRNVLVNGCFRVWQRGTSQTSNGYGSDDRWLNGNNGSTKTHSQQAFTVGQTDVPGNPQFFSRTVVTSVAGVDNFVYKGQRIEDVRTLSGQTATLSFWAKADAAKNIAIEFQQNLGTGGSPSSAVLGIGVTTVSLTTTWRYYTVTVAVPSLSGKTLGTNNDHSFQINFWFDAGSNINARTNSLGQQSGTFDIAMVQMESGAATPFERRPIGVETMLCKRYCHVVVATGASFLGISKGTGGTSTDCWIYFPTTMRPGTMTYASTATITFTPYAYVTGTMATATTSAPSINFFDTNKCLLSVSGHGAISGGTGVSMDASGGNIIFSVEL